MDMAEKKQILVVSDTGSSSQYEDTIAPVPNQIRRLSIDSTEEEEDIEIRRINPVFKEQVVSFYVVLLYTYSIIFIFWDCRLADMLLVSFIPSQIQVVMNFTLMSGLANPLVIFNVYGPTIPESTCSQVPRPILVNS